MEPRQLLHQAFGRHWSLVLPPAACGKWRFLASAARKMDVTMFGRPSFLRSSPVGLFLNHPWRDVECCYICRTLMLKRPGKSLLVECWQVLRVRHFFETAGQVMWQVASDHAWCKGLALCMIVTQCFALKWRVLSKVSLATQRICLFEEGELRHGCYFSTASGWACSAWANLVVSSCGAWSFHLPVRAVGLHLLIFVVNSQFWSMRGIWK